MKIIACGVLAASLAVSAFADVAFSSFGPGDSFTSPTGIGIGGLSFQSGAFQFTSATTGVLATVEFAAFTVRNGNVTVHLRTDDNNELGDELIAWDTALNTDTPMVRTLTNSLQSVALSAGSKYWLEIRPVTNGMYAAWCDNDQGLFSRAYYQSTGGEGYLTLPTATFRVNTNVVPEPASMAALGLGALALVRKRRKSA